MTAFNAHIFNACPVRGLIFFFSSSIPSPDGFLLLQISRGCQIFQSAPGWNEQSFLATLFFLPSPFSRSLPPSDNSPPALRPLHVIPKEQKQEKENKKRACNRDPEPRGGGRKERAKEDPKGRKRKGWTATKRSDCGNFPAPLVQQCECFGRA